MNREERRENTAKECVKKYYEEEIETLHPQIFLVCEFSQSLGAEHNLWKNDLAIR